VAPVAVTVEGMQELHLTREEEVSWREEALAVREAKAKISEQALA
jgi:hypothetical protein